MRDQPAINRIPHRIHIKQHPFRADILVSITPTNIEKRTIVKDRELVHSLREIASGIVGNGVDIGGIQKCVRIPGFGGDLVTEVISCALLQCVDDLLQCVCIRVAVPACAVLRWCDALFVVWAEDI